MRIFIDMVEKIQIQDSVLNFNVNPALVPSLIEVFTNNLAVRAMNNKQIKTCAFIYPDKIYITT